MSITTFYARSRWGSRWGVVDAYHTTPHKGLDIRGISRQAVPVLRSGTIVADAPSPSVGRYITVRVRVSGGYQYDTYCHVVSRGRTGSVKADETLALLAGWDDAHGTSWSGPHLHLARSTTAGGWAYWGAANLNPEPVVITALTQAAGGSGVPLPDSPETIRKKGSKDMSILLYGPDTGTATAPGPKVFVVASPGVWDRYSASFAVPLGSQYGSAVELSLASMLAKQEQYLNPIGYGGGTAPGAATAAEIAAETKTLLASDFAAIPAAVIDEQKKPGN